MRLIDADALIKVIQQNDYMLTAKHNSIAPGMFTSGIRQAVDESQTIDPVKHENMNDIEADLLIANAKIKKLKQQLSASQRRERAAVEDFTSAAHDGNILCEFCGADCIDAGNDTGGDTCQCGCFEWRGPVAGKGETE